MMNYLLLNGDIRGQDYQTCDETPKWKTRAVCDVPAVPKADFENKNILQKRKLVFGTFRDRIVGRCKAKIVTCGKKKSFKGYECIPRFMLFVQTLTCPDRITWQAFLLWKIMYWLQTFPLEWFCYIYFCMCRACLFVAYFKRSLNQDALILLKNVTGTSYSISLIIIVLNMISIFKPRGEPVFIRQVIFETG